MIAFDPARPAVYDTPVTEPLVISLRAMRFHALVGILPHERELPQPLELDIETWVDAAPRASGEPPALDYRALYALVAERVGRAPIAYLEDLVCDVARAALALDGVTRARVAARKPHVALGGPLAGAEVAVEMRR